MVPLRVSLAINLPNQGSRTCRARLEALDTSSLATLVRFQSAINYSQWALPPRTPLAADWGHDSFTHRTIQGALNTLTGTLSRPTINSLLEAGNFDSRRVVAILFAGFHPMPFQFYNLHNRNFMIDKFRRMLVETFYVKSRAAKWLPCF